MDTRSFEQVTLGDTLVGNSAQYLKANDIYQVLLHDGQAVGIRFPKKVRLLVTEADEGARGNTVSGAGKVVKTETGLTVTVPLFIKEGDTIAIDTETGAYLERA